MNKYDARLYLALALAFLCGMTVAFLMNASR